MPARLFKVIAQAMVPHMFVAAHAAVLRRIGEVIAVGAEGFWVLTGLTIQVFVARQAARVIDESLAVLAVAVPVDVFGCLDDFHHRVHDPVFCLDKKVVQRVVVG